MLLPIVKHGQSSHNHSVTGANLPHAAHEDLDWRGVDFVEYDVEQDREAYERMLELTDGNRAMLMIVEEDKPVQVGWMGQGCFV